MASRTLVTIAVTAFIALVSQQSSSQESVSGSVSAANRSFQEAISGPKSRVYAGTILTVNVVNGQADINFVHRERRKCKWYGKCWYERWIDHNFKSPTGEMWPIQYQLVDENGATVAGSMVISADKTVKIKAPISPTEYPSSFRLQARFADTQQVTIDPNRTNGVFELQVSFDTSVRLSTFPKFLNNGAFLPLAREIGPMIELDVWTREDGSSALSRALVNYARVSFPSENALKKEEHFKLLEIAQSLDPESDTVSRALVDHYVATGNFSSASDEINSKLELREQQLDGDPNNRSLRLALAKDYAFLAALTEREGTLLTPQAYKRVDSLYDRSVRHATRANSRELLAKILSARATLLRKSNTPTGLADAANAQRHVVELLGRSINGNVVSLSPDNKYLLVTKRPPTTGMINQKIGEIKSDRDLQSRALGFPEMETKRKITPLFVGTSGDVLVDDGGILSVMDLDSNGKFVVEQIDNVTFQKAQRYRGGIFGITKNGERFRISVLPQGGELESIPFGLAADLDKIPLSSTEEEIIEAESRNLSNLYDFSVSEKANVSVVYGRTKNPAIRAFEIFGKQLRPLNITHNFDNATIRELSVSPSGKHLAIFYTRTPVLDPQPDPPPADEFFLEIIPTSGGEPRTFSFSDFPGTVENPAQFISNISALTFSSDGRFLAILSSIDIIRIDVKTGFVSRVEAIDSSPTPYEGIPHLFGLDNEGALVAAARNLDGGPGKIFRLSYDAQSGTYSSNPDRKSVANRVLETRDIVIHFRDGTLNVGIPRYTRGEFSVLNLDTLETYTFDGQAVHFDDVQLLSGGRFMVSVDTLTNSIVLVDLVAGAALPPINPVTDLDSKAENDGTALRPIVFPLVDTNRWCLIWLDRQTSSVRFVSKYEGSKRLSTFEFDDGLLTSIIEALKPTIEHEAVRAQGGPVTSSARFVLSFNESEHVDRVAPHRTPMVTISHALEEFAAVSTLLELPAPLNDPIRVPVLDITRDEMQIEYVKAPRYGRVVGLKRNDDGRNKMLLEHQGRFKIFSEEGTEIAILSPAIPDGETLLQSIFVPKFTELGNVAGSTVVFLIRNPDGLARVTYAFINETGDSVINCGFCDPSYFRPEKFYKSGSDTFPPAELVSLVGESQAVVAVPRDDKFMIYSRRSNGLPSDEIPLDRIGMISEEGRHIVRSKNRAVEIYSRLH